MRSRGRIAAFCAVLALPALAQDDTQITLDAHQVIVRFEPPPWSTRENLAQTSDVFRKEGEGEAGGAMVSFLALPKGDVPKDWTRIYGVLAEHPVTGDFESYVAGEERLFARKCTQAAPIFERKLDDETRLMIISCAALEDRPAQGEVAIFKMTRLEQTMVRAYQHFRVPAFDLADVERRPPVALDVLRAALVRVGRLSLDPKRD